MRRIILSILFLSIVAFSFAEPILWYSNYEEAQTAAVEDDKNIFVLITAPSWCVWCVRLEENVLSEEAFQEYLGEHYIALKLLDVVDGMRNPELENFYFKGYPNVSVYDSDKGFVGDVYTQSIDEMLTLLENYKDAQGEFIPLPKDLILPDKYIFQAEPDADGTPKSKSKIKTEAESDGGGEYLNNHDGTWTLISSEGEYTYLFLDNDYEYLYLERDDNAHYIALSLNGTERLMSAVIDEQFIWLNLSDVQRVGGDEYFNNPKNNESGE